MKTVLALFISVMATTAHAETVNEIRSKSIMKILNTPMLKEFFGSKDSSMGNIKSIQYIDKASTDQAAKYQFLLEGPSGANIVRCAFIATVDISKGVGKISFDTPKCQEFAVVPETTPTCKNPSPTGCKD